MEQDSDTPELSILMVNWNTREMTLACLRTVFAQTAQTSFEIVLVDNASADGSAAAIAAEFPQVRLIAEPVNHGFGRANNIAANQARGRFLLLLNTDTLVLDGAIDKLMAFARQRPEAGIWGGRTVFEDGTLNIGSAWGRITPWSAISQAIGLKALFGGSEFFNPEGIGSWRRDTVREVDIVSGCFLLIERPLWDRLSGFDPIFFMYGEEADLCARARALGAQPVTTPDATIVHHGGASAARVADKMVLVQGSRIELLKRNFRGLPAWMGVKATIFHIWLRAAAFSLAASLGLSKGRRDSAAEWRNAWRRRGEWMHGAVKRP